MNCKVRNVLYESACVLCNGDRVEKKNKWGSFREMVGVYVGETSKSIFERAGEHWQDVKAGKVESHMLKHWETDHSDDKGLPKFKIRIVRTCQDALSRQVGESVRIDLRGGNVLNFKTEYSRCRLPRLTIDREEWKSAKQQEKKVADDENAKFDGELTEEELNWLTKEEGMMATWNEDSARKEFKRKTADGARGQRSAKRKKLERLVDWGTNGEGEEDQEGVRKWLLGEHEEPVTELVETGVPLLELRRPEMKLKQMELGFIKVLEPVEEGDIELVVEEAETTEDTHETSRPVQNPKLKRKKTLKKLASENQKVTSWFGKKLLPTLATNQGHHEEAELVERMEEDTPVLMNVDTVIRKEQAKLKQAKLIKKLEVKSIVMELVNKVVARSDVNRILEEIMKRCTWIISIGEVWRLLQDDQPLQEAIMKKIARQEADLRIAYDEIEKEERLHKVSNLKKTFVGVKAEREMVDFGEMMSCLEITMRKESRLEDYKEYEYWDYDEQMEHLELDVWWEENVSGVDTIMTEDDMVVDIELEHDYIDGVMEGLSQMLDLVELEDQPVDREMVASRRQLEDEDMELDSVMIWRSQEEVQEDGYVLGGMWYLNNWVLTSRMSEEQWKASTEMVGRGKTTNPTIKYKPRQTLVSSLCKYTEKTGLKCCEEMQLNLISNLVGVKGTAGGRKRPRGCSGGWRTGWHGCLPTRKCWKRAGRFSQIQDVSSCGGQVIAHMSTQFSDWPTIDKAAGWTTLPKPADSVFKTNVTRNACTVLVKNKIQVDHSDVQNKEQVTEVVTVLKVDTEKEAADDPVWGMWRQENPISDKSKPDGGGPD